MAHIPVAWSRSSRRLEQSVSASAWCLNEGLQIVHVGPGERIVADVPGEPGANRVLKDVTSHGVARLVVVQNPFVIAALPQRSTGLLSVRAVRRLRESRHQGIHIRRL